MIDVIVVLCAALLAGAVAAVTTRGIWPVEILVSLAPQAAVISMVAALAMLGLGRYLSAAMCGLAAILFLLALKALLEPVTRVDDAQSLILWHNAFGKADAVRRVMETALAERADIVAFAEYPVSYAAPQTFRAAFPYVFPSPDKTVDGPVVFSRTKFESTSFLESGRRPTAKVVVATSSGPLTVIAVHAPVAWTPAKLKRQAHVIAGALAAADAGARSIVVGDFNAAAWNASITKPLEMADSIRRGSLGVGATWLAPTAFLGIPIDHAFATMDLDLGVRLGPATGSDHRPLVVSVRTAATTAASPSPR